MRLKWKIKMSAIVIIALAIIFLAYSRVDAFKMASAEEIVEEKKEESKLKGWGSKLFDVLDQEVEDTKSYQKKQWQKMKKQFRDLFNGDDKGWKELDKTMEEKDETKEEK